MNCDKAKDCIDCCKKFTCSIGRIVNIVVDIVINIVNNIIDEKTEPVYFNAVYVGGFQEVAPEGSVNFLLDNQSGDFSFTPNTSIITVNKAGIYRIDYEVTLKPTEGKINAAYAVAINGIENPFSFFGMHHNGGTNERFELTGFFIADIPAGATVELKNKSSTTDLLEGTGIDNQAVNRASIIIEKI